MEIISELMLSMNELSKPWLEKKTKELNAIESPKANLILVQTSPYPLLLCFFLTLIHNLEKKRFELFS
jgi:hypothetical protein